MKKQLFVLLMVLTAFGCGGKKSTPTPIPAPSKVTLVAPESNSACTSGTTISDTESNVTFSWNRSDNTENYELSVTNKLTGNVITLSTSNTQIKVDLLKNTPYSWYITSTSSKTNATSVSTVWKFYNSGPGAVSYAPFPADNMSPTFGESVTATVGKIDLSWVGSDVDGDISYYDVYFGNNSSPTIFKSKVSDMFSKNVGVVSGTTYYWKVITTDSHGNKSDSGVSQFTVK